MLTWDAHICLPIHPDADFSALDAFRAHGVDYISINVGMDFNPLSQVMQTIAGFRASIERAPEKYRLARTVAEIESAKADGALAIGFDLEGSIPLMDRPEMVAVYRALGVNQIHFAYNRNNRVADGCHDVERGLTDLGRRMVRAVNEAGMLMDCSHTGRRCSLDTMAESSKPVIFSHANPLGLVEHGRNITDEQIKACAATGGVVCVSGVSWFLGSATPSADDLARHVAYVADLVGIDHVGIGTDISFHQAGLDDTPPGGFDPSYWWPKSAGYDQALAKVEYAPVEVWSELRASLAGVGIAREDAAKVMGGNMERVARQTWGQP
ncbi:MAG: membrane dipeptidase [Betaproteobacteria bacterium]|nr:membrane dipeptidase [Betaproteobacteria bacterium]